MFSHHIPISPIRLRASRITTPNSLTTLHYVMLMLLLTFAFPRVLTMTMIQTLDFEP